MVAFLFFWVVSAHSMGLTGKVVGIADGDTITILTQDKAQVKIRLYGIDTPEKSQAFGRKAKKFTSRLVAGKTVAVKSYDRDKYGRTVGVVYVDSINVNEEIIKAGYAWQYRKYCKAPFCSKWLSFEREARINRIGLFASSHPQPPWKWRKEKKNAVRSSHDVFRSGVDSSAVYHGNIKSHVFHGPGCRYFNCKNCTMSFSSKSLAIKSGYHAHKSCVK